MISSLCFSLAEIAQLVEHLPEEEGVAGSNPALGTNQTQNPDCLGFCAICEPEPCRKTTGEVWQQALGIFHHNNSSVW